MGYRQQPEIELCQVERNSFHCSRKVVRAAAAAAVSKHWAHHKPPRARRYCQQQNDGRWSHQHYSLSSCSSLLYALRDVLVLSRDHNCDSTTTRLRYVVYDDTTTHSTTTEVIEITIRLRYDNDKINGRGHWMSITAIRDCYWHAILILSRPCRRLLAS